MVPVVSRPDARVVWPGFEYRSLSKDKSDLVLVRSQPINPPLPNTASLELFVIRMFISWALFFPCLGSFKVGNPSPFSTLCSPTRLDPPGSLFPPLNTSPPSSRNVYDT